MVINAGTFIAAIRNAVTVRVQEIIITGTDITAVRYTVTIHVQSIIISLTDITAIGNRVAVGVNGIVKSGTKIAVVRHPISIAVQITLIRNRVAIAVQAEARFQIGQVGYAVVIAVRITAIPRLGTYFISSAGRTARGTLAFTITSFLTVAEQFVRARTAECCVVIQTVACSVTGIRGGTDGVRLVTAGIAGSRKGMSTKSVTVTNVAGTLVAVIRTGCPRPQWHI